MQERNQLAVFIDFDNIEIGVKSTLNSTLDLSLVLDALKERGEVVAKSAYGDWARAGNHSRTLTDHAVHMVQRNVTPRGDKNGADINLVVDALEMCFTQPHIDGFAIVGGDSDFIALVEKLKQFGKRVYIVGGRAFTSGTLQRNCHEFISYENLLGGARGRGGAQARGSAGARISLEKGFTKVQRALKILADRGVQPQLGPIKSTLLQLDSTFSERDYGTSSFREFIQRLADKHLLSMKRIDQGYLVETNGDGAAVAEEAASKPRSSRAKKTSAAKKSETASEEEAVSAADSLPASEGLQLLGKATINMAEKRAGKPVYVRHLAQELRALDGEFDETRYGYRTLTEMAQEAQKAGFLSMQRDRVGAWRVSLPEGGEASVAKAAAAAADSVAKAATGGKKVATKKKSAAKKSTTKKKTAAKKTTAKKTTAKKAGAKKAAVKKTSAKKVVAKKAATSNDAD